MRVCGTSLTANGSIPSGLCRDDRCRGIAQAHLPAPSPLPSRTRRSVFQPFGLLLVRRLVVQLGLEEVAVLLIRRLALGVTVPSSIFQSLNTTFIQLASCSRKNLNAVQREVPITCDNRQGVLLSGSDYKSIRRIFVMPRQLRCRQHFI